MSWEDEVTSVDTPSVRAERARVLLLKALQAADIPAAVRELFGSDELAGISACTVELERLRAIPRLGATITRLERASRAAAQQIRVRIATEHEVPCVRAALEAPEDWPDYPVPVGYEASPRGIVRLERQGEAVVPVLVSHEPIYVVGVRIDVGTGHERLELGFRRHGQWRRLVVDRELAGDARALVALRGQGVPVSSVTSRGLVAWLDACEAMAPELPRSQCTTRTGWHGNVYLQGPGTALQLEDPEEHKTGWRSSGTWEGWLEALSIIEDEPAAWLVLYAACIAPLLRWLELGHCPILDLSGPRGRGKTTCLRLAGSGWGRPDELAGGTILTWDSSPTNIERIAGCTWDAPLLLDDTKRARKPTDVTQALYALAQGRGRGRGTPGGVQRTSTWRTVAVSTGEAPLIEATEAGGARARVLSVDITPAIRSLEVAKRLEAQLAAHHGHLGPKLAARALQLGPELRVRYQQRLAWWAAQIPADTRLLSTVSAMDVAHGVTRELELPEPQCDWMGALAEALRTSVTAADQSSRALELVRDELVMHTASYRGKEAIRVLAAFGGTRVEEPIPPPGGYRGIWRQGDDWVGIYPQVLRQLLEDAGHDFTPVVTLWAEQGVLHCTRGNQHEVGITKGEKHRVYAFLRDHVLG
jgi:putative DNA primase/helicase